jgi:hypothetical protein
MAQAARRNTQEMDEKMARNRVEDMSIGGF